MSAINDAPKCAIEPPKASPSTPGAEVQFRPAEPAQQENPGSRLTLPSVAYLFMLSVFLVLGVLLLREMNRRVEVKAKTPPPAAPGKADVATIPTAPSARTPQSAATGTAASASAVVQTVAPQPAPLRLQAVFFSPTRPSAMIGGKTVLVGDRIGAFRVTKITPDSATLESEDQTKLLRLK